MRWLGTAARSAQPSQSHSATTRVPAAGPLPSAAARSTTPAMSWPGRQPSGRTWNSRNSPRLSEKAWTATSASFGRNLGLRDLADRDRLGPGRGIDDGEHGPPLKTPRPSLREPEEPDPRQPWKGEGLRLPTPSPASKCVRRHPLPHCGRGADARLVQPEIGDVLGIGLQFADLHPADDVGQDRVGRGRNADLLALPRRQSR